MNILVNPRKLAPIVNPFNISQNTVNQINTKKHMYLAVVGNELKVVHKNWFGRLLMKIGLSNASVNKVAACMAKHSNQTCLSLYNHMITSLDELKTNVTFFPDLLPYDKLLLKLNKNSKIAKRFGKIFVSLFKKDFVQKIRVLRANGGSAPFSGFTPKVNEELHSTTTSNTGFAIQRIIDGFVSSRLYAKLSMLVNDSDISVEDKQTILITLLYTEKNEIPEGLKQNVKQAMEDNTKSFLSLQSFDNLLEIVKNIYHKKEVKEIILNTILHFPGIPEEIKQKAHELKGLL